VSETTEHAHAELLGQTVVVIGGSSGIGFDTARRAREAGADVIITARDPDSVYRAGLELGCSIAAFDAMDFDRLERFFDELPAPIDHVMVTGPAVSYAPLAQLDIGQARREIETHLLLPMQVARHAVGKVRAGGTLLFASGSGRHPAPPRLTLTSPLTAAKFALTRNLAVELAPMRVNSIASGVVDTVLSDDVSALAIHLMTNATLTGATYDLDSGRQLVES
jgi:NAD(P)-dependent dehydrogenase (short-subunit alcohol dehydrogenase family)